MSAGHQSAQCWSSLPKLNHDMRYLYPVFFLILVAFSASAQQVPQYSLIQFNRASANPAVAGSSGYLEAAGVFRKQWLGLDGSPMSQNLNIHAPIYFLNSGVGLNISNDFVGAERTTSANLQYSYILRLGDETVVSLGIGAGIVQKELDGTRLLAPEGLYEGGTFFHDDEFLPETRESAFSYNTSAGIYVRWKDLAVGFSSINLTESSIDYQFNTAPVDYRFSRHYLGFISYRVGINEDLGVEPSIFAKTDGIQTQMDFNVTFDYLSRFYLGLGYRGFGKTTTDAAILLGGLTLSKNTTILYSYDYTLSGLNAVSGGSHEVMLSYRLGKKIGEGKLPKAIHNPRFP